MKNNKKIIYTVLRSLVIVALSGVIFSSCNDEIDYPINSSCGIYETSVRITLSEAPEITEGETRAIDSSEVSENGVRDVWLIEYDSSGNRVGNPTYLDLKSNGQTSEVNLFLPDSDDEKDNITLIALANTHDSEMGVILRQLNTISELEKLNSYIDDATQCCTTSNQLSDTQKGYHYLLMSGQQKLSKSTKSINVTLFRNLAKLKINIKNWENSGIEIKYIQLKSVPTAIPYADCIIKQANAFASAYQDFTKEEWEGTQISKDGVNGEEMDLLYYLPRNMCGNNKSETVANKNIDAPAYATYLEVSGIKKDGGAIKYSFYVGKNMVNNFDIEPNHCYELPIVITSSGTTADSRVHMLTDKVFGEANSYIINYMPVDFETVQPMGTIPVTRINKFWKCDFEGKHNNEHLYSDTEWIAEVIWQDSEEDLFYFCDATGNKLTNTPHFFESIGETPLRVRPTGKGSGNVLIGLRPRDFIVDPDNPSNTKNGYFWSWHLWITDYDPSSVRNLEEGIDVYPVTGGKVHRFNSKYWKEENPASEGICIMDRNYGAKISKYDTSGISQDAGMYYFYGRKDPFPWRYDGGSILYKYEAVKNDSGDIIGETMVNEDKNKKFILARVSATSIPNAVRFPHVMYFDGDAYWSSNRDINTYNVYDWNDGDKRGEKHFFDPTPEGWRLPLRAEVPPNSLVEQYHFSSGCAIKLRTGATADDGSEIYDYAFFPFSGSQRPSGNNNYTSTLRTTSYTITSDKVTGPKNVSFWQGTATAISSVNSQNIRLSHPTRLIRDIKSNN